MISFETPSVKMLGNIPETITNQLIIRDKDSLKLICWRSWNVLWYIDREANYILLSTLSNIEEKFFNKKLEILKKKTKVY